MNNIPDHQTLCGYVQSFQEAINVGDIENALRFAEYFKWMPIEFNIQLVRNQMRSLPNYGIDVNQDLYQQLRDIGYDERSCIIGARGNFSLEDAIKVLKHSLIPQ